jgi:hypothetical protein
VDEEFYFSRADVVFDWEDNGTDVAFWPVLKEIGPLATSINHLPSPEDSALLRKPLEITLSNEPYGASEERLINTLRDSHILENARVEWTQIALADPPTTSRIDLTSLVGDEHTFRYRGRVRRVGPISNESIVLDRWRGHAAPTRHRRSPATSASGGPRSQAKRRRWSALTTTWDFCLPTWPLTTAPSNR